MVQQHRGLLVVALVLLLAIAHRIFEQYGHRVFGVTRICRRACPIQQFSSISDSDVHDHINGLSKLGPRRLHLL